MASWKPSSLLLFGATGTIGRFIAQSILAARPALGSPRITVFTSPAPSGAKAELLRGWEAAGVSVITGDVASAADVARAYASSGADTVISSLGRDAIGAQAEMIRQAERSGSVRWFLPSEFGTDTQHGERSAHERPHQAKRMVHRLVRDEVRRLKVTYVVTGPYFDMWADTPALRDALGGFDVGGRRAVVAGDGEQKISFTTKTDVGRAVVAALQHPEAAAGRTLRVASFVVSPNQVRAEYEAQAGGPFDTRYIPLTEFEALERALWEEGRQPNATIATLRRIWATGGAEYPELDNAAIGLGEDGLESLSEAVRQQIEGK
ncbi:Isoflavone reductase [Escovopsis weberi]|uniref:Isoflavone reductase n=1 Tax=Escovopsis weberi TaxID=150374 RepID=A0A0M8N3H3_ESCWE|nr:Isoflavone reductase [Escovopsis weberi]